ncbi:MAG: hypothetical protein QOJ65_1108, partial [Fimbriimonadaceae bacterium]|nr:hypothetical protein [Fimbriimonadaceae bacterium]
MIGCGGGGGGGGTKDPTTGTTGVPGAGPGDSIAMVNLPAPSSPAGRVNVAYLPLQGRALENFTVLIRNIQLGFNSETFVEPLATPISFVLNGNEVQQRSASVHVDNRLSQFFNIFYLNIDTLVDDPSPGGPPDDDKFSVGTPNSPFVQELPFDATIRVFPSRETTVPIFLNDSMIDVSRDADGNPQGATFLSDIFRAKNEPIQGFISDFLGFDTSLMGAKRPVMSNSQFADRVYFSGDRFGLSAKGPKGYFEMLTTDLV